MTGYGKGYLPDPLGMRKTSFRHLKTKLGGTIALTRSGGVQGYVVNNGGPGILDQGQTGSCVGHASAGAIATRFAAIGHPIACPSPIGIYALARCIDRAPGSPLEDGGTEPNQAMRGITEWGICSAKTWGNYPADPSTINDEPTVAQLEADAGFELMGQYAIDSSGDAFVIDLMTALSAQYPVAIALYADSKFENYMGGILDAMDQTDPNGGGHYTYACGYSWDGSNPSSIVLECVNSWGTSWGENGFYRGNRAFVDQLQDCYVMNVAPIHVGDLEQ